MKSLLFIVFLSFHLINGGIYAQPQVHAIGQSQIKIEDHMSKEQAKAEALKLAEVNAINSVFGSYVEQQTEFQIKEGIVNYNLIGGTKVRGIWVKNTIDPQYEYHVQYELVDKKREPYVYVTCRVEGEIREIIPKARFEFLTLKCEKAQCVSESFLSNESLFIYFKSPIDGYLAIFNVESDSTRRLLPYRSMGTMNAVKVNGDKEYIFFSDKNGFNYFPDFIVDNIVLYTDRNTEYNTLYAIFSEKEFKKPILSKPSITSDNYILPRALSTPDFTEWMGNCRAELPDFQEDKVGIKIYKKK
jgi:hypothetical protein